MPRIAKADVNRALQLAASTIIEAGGRDGRTSRAEIKAKLSTLPPSERKLADSFFKFIDSRDFKVGAQVTAKDVNRAVAYAKKHMVEKYDLNSNGLSKAEISRMSLTGKAAVDLSRALKLAAAPLTGTDLTQAIKVASKGANWTSESDYAPEAISGKPANNAGITEENVKAAFGPQLTKFFLGGDDDEVGSLKDMAFEIDNATESKKFIADLATFRPGNPVNMEELKAWAALKGVLDNNLTDVRVVKVGPKDDDGSLASDHGLYSYMMVGKTADGQLAGVMFGSVET